MGGVKQLMAVVVVVAALLASSAEGYISKKAWAAIRRANQDGPFVGLVVPNAYEMVPVLNSSRFLASETVSLTWTSKLNAGLTTQLLLSLFRVKGIVHWGIAGNANEKLQIGDVTIPEYWAHLSLWNWQRYGDGEETELPLEATGDYTREYGFLNFSDYTVGRKQINNPALSASELNSIWYQPEEIFPASGVPEERQHAFWVRAGRRYYALAAKLEGMELPACLDAATCLPRAPRVTRVPRGCSANMYLDNARYRQFIRKQFGCTPVEMESAAVALVAYQQGVPYLTIRSLSDFAGGGSALGNEASTFLAIAAQNAVDVMFRFVELLADQAGEEAGATGM